MESGAAGGTTAGNHAAAFQERKAPQGAGGILMKKGLLIVVSSPSGGGKGTILKALFARNENLRLSVSATTRAPREGEQDGVHYHFITRNSSGRTSRTARCSNTPNTAKTTTGRRRRRSGWLEAGHDVVLEIEVQGGRQIKAAAPDCVSLFILPPSLEVLEKRLRGRGTETEAVIEKRLRAAEEEIRCVKDYDYAVVNDTVEQAVSEIESILTAEKLRVSREENIAERILNHA